MASSKVELKEMYEEVIENVIQGIRELFLSNGVEKSVLEDLQRIWKNKLLRSGAVPSDQALEAVAPSEAAKVAEVPLQIILLSEPVLNQNRLWQIQLPLTALNQKLVQEMLNKTPNSTTSNPTPQQTDALMQKDAQNTSSSRGTTIAQNPSFPKMKKIEQMDGPQDSSDDNDSTSEAEENSDKGDLIEEQPLNSDDDISEEEDSFDTDNIIVCQYEKISRRFNKWKFYLKSGIMNLDGKDHAFKWFIGEADW